MYVLLANYAQDRDFCMVKNRREGIYNDEHWFHNNTKS